MSETIGAAKPNYAETWKRKTYQVEFPSGLKAEMTTPNALSLMAESDQIPDTFFTLMTEAQATGTNPTESMTGAQLREFFKTISFLSLQIAKEHFVNPKVTDNPDYDNFEVSPNDVKGMLTMADQQFLMALGMDGRDPVGLLARFRQEQERVLALVQNGGGVR
jgi:hypothetical protein